MKKLIVLALVCLLAVSANAQFSFGVKGGVNTNKLAGASEFYYPLNNANLGFNIGVYTNFKLSRKLSLSPEFQYIRKGDSNYGFHFNYLEIPVLLEIDLGKNLGLQVGPSLGQKIWTYRNPGPGANGISFSTYDTDLDLGLNGGLKFKVNEKISVLGRYSQGLLAYQRPYSGPNIYTRNFQLSMSYRIK